MGAVGCTRDMRIRQIGSLALSLCSVATGVADVLVAAVPSRSVDLAAGLLILREAGGGAVTLSGEDILQQPLDLEKRSPFVAWRTGLDEDEILYRSRQLRRELLEGC
jgi:fructose-1,6-bisphosphatase/inositol monophosphatase family enzyme